MDIAYKNLQGSRPLLQVVRHKDEEVVFTLTSTIDKSKKFDLGSSEQFELVCKYLEHKGDKFTDEVFETLKEFSDITTGLYEDVEYLFKQCMAKFINLFDYDDMRMFIISYPIIPPTNLIDEFNEVSESDNIGTRIQTYTKTQYLDLVALTILTKLTVGPLASYYINNPSITMKSAKEHSLVVLMLTRDSWLREHHTTKKLFGSFEVIVNNAIRSTKDKGIILSKGIDKEELAVYMLGLVYVKLMAVSIITRDTHNANLITFIYSSVGKLIKPKQNIAEKAPLPDDGGLPESAMEILRMVSDEMVGHVEEFKFFIADPVYVLDCYGLVDKDDIRRSVERTVKKILDTNIVNHNMVLLCGWVLSITPINNDERSIGFIRPEALKHYGIKEIGNVYVAVYMILYYLNFRDLAELVVSIPLEDRVITPNEGKAHVSKETRSKLEKYYTLNTTVEQGKNGANNLLIKAINELANNIASEDYKTILPLKLRWSDSEFIAYKPDLRERLAQLLLKLFSLREEN
jgi:hypothetical protein